MGGAFWGEQAEPVMETLPQKKVDRAAVKREADIKEAEEEKKIISKFIQFIQIHAPELLEKYITCATQDWKAETRGFMGLNPLPGYVESKIKLYAEEKGIWQEWLRSEGLNMN